MENRYIGIIKTSITNLNSFLIKLSLKATKRNGTMGRVYLMMSLWDTNKIEKKNIPTNQASSVSFCLIKLNNPNMPKR